MGTHRYGEPGEETDGSDEHRPVPGLTDPGRIHVTLDNLADLANFDGSVLSGYGAGNGRVGGPGLVDVPPAPEIPGTPEVRATIPAFPATPPMPPMPPPPIPLGRAYDEAPPGPVPGDAPRPVLPDAPDRFDGPGHAGGPGDHAAGALVPVEAPGAPPAAAAVPGFYAGTSTRDPQAPDTGTHQEFYAGTSDPDATGYGEFWGSADDNLPVLADAGAPAPVAEPVRRAAWARPAERWLLELLALAAASAALVLPSVTVVAVVVAVVVGATLAFVASGRSAGALPGRVAVRSLRLLHPRSSLWLPVLLSRTVLAAVAIPAGVAALTWVDDHGRNGVVAAARAGAWDDGFRVFATLLCAMLLTSVGDGRRQRATAIRRWAAPATDGTLVILAVSCCAVVGLVVAAVPHPADPIAGRADGLGWLPPGGREMADRVRDDIVTAELDSVASCLSQRTDTNWSTSYTAANPIEARDIARLTAQYDPPPVDLATAVMAAHNQLAPWVEVIEIEWRGQVRLRTNREDLLRHRPVLDKDRLIAATPEGSAWLVVVPLDVTLGLRCSAGPVL